MEGNVLHQRWCWLSEVLDELVAKEGGVDLDDGQHLDCRLQLLAVPEQILGTAAVDVGVNLLPGCRHQLQHIVHVVQKCGQQGLVESDFEYQILSAFCV